MCQGRTLEYGAFVMIKKVLLQLQPTFFFITEFLDIEGSACPESLQSNLLLVDIFWLLILDLAEKVCHGQTLETGGLVLM